MELLDCCVWQGKLAGGGQHHQLFQDSECNWVKVPPQSGTSTCSAGCSLASEELIEDGGLMPGRRAAELAGVE